MHHPCEDPGHAGLTKNTATDSLIQPFLGLSGDVASQLDPPRLLLRLRVLLRPVRANPTQEAEFFLWERISQAKRDKIRGARLPPMRESPLINTKWKLGVEGKKLRGSRRREKNFRHGAGNQEPVKRATDTKILYTTQEIEASPKTCPSKRRSQSTRPIGTAQCRCATRQ
jgi:hypothetical protein